MHINADFDVDEKSLQETIAKLEPKLRKGAEKGLEDTLDVGKGRAVTRIKNYRNPFTAIHLENRTSFYTHTTQEANTIDGDIRNAREYAAFVDKGVSGTQNQRETPFKYTDSKPPLQKLIPWVDKHLDDWDIDKDVDLDKLFAEDSQSAREQTKDDGSEYYQDLDEYDLKEKYRKERLESVPAFHRDLDIRLDDGSGIPDTATVFRTEADDLDDDKIRVEIRGKLKDIEPGSQYDIIGREDKTTWFELEKGDQAVFEEYPGGMRTRARYVTINGDPESRIRDSGIPDRFADHPNADQITGSAEGVAIHGDEVFDPVAGSEVFFKSHYVGTREENPDLWAKQVDTSETISEAPDGYEEIDLTSLPSARRQSKLIRHLSHRREDIVLETPAGENRIANIYNTRNARDRANLVIDTEYVLYAGTDEDGNEITFEFDTVGQLTESDYSLDSIERNLKQYVNLQRGDEVIVDTNNMGEQDLLDSTPFGVQYIRARVVRDNDLGASALNQKAIVPSGLQESSPQLSSIQPESVLSTRERRPDLWNIKNDLETGNSISYETYEDTSSAIFLRDEVTDAKNYHVKRKQIYDTEEQEIRTISARKINSVGSETLNEPKSKPSDAEIDNNLPDGYKRHELISSEDLSQQKDYIVFDHRKDEFYKAEYDDEDYYYDLRPVSNGDTNRPLKRLGESGYKDPEDHVYPVTIVGVGNDRDYPDAADTLTRRENGIGFDDAYVGMEVVYRDHQKNKWVEGEAIKVTPEEVKLSIDATKHGTSFVRMRFADLNGSEFSYEVTHSDSFQDLSDSAKVNHLQSQLDNIPVDANNYSQSDFAEPVKEDLIDNARNLDILKQPVNRLINVKDNNKIRAAATTDPNEQRIKVAPNGSTPASTMKHEFLHTIVHSNEYITPEYPDDNPDWQFSPNGAQSNPDLLHATPYFITGANKNYNGEYWAGGNWANLDSDFVGKGNIKKPVKKELEPLDIDAEREDRKTPSIKKKDSNGDYIFDIDIGENVLVEKNGDKFLFRFEEIRSEYQYVVYDYRRGCDAAVALDQESGELLLQPSLIDLPSGKEKKPANYIDNYGVTSTKSDWEPQSTDPLERLIETANYVWWKGVLRESTETPTDKEYWATSILSDYSLRSPSETITLTTEVLSSNESRKGSINPELADALELQHQQMIEVWSDLFELSDDVSSLLLGDYE